MSKKDVRIYFEADYCDHLKQVADEQGASLNQLIVSTVKKKYPMPRKEKEARVYLNEDEHEHLKNIAQAQKISMSELMRLAVLKEYKISKSKKPEVANECQDDAGCILSADDEQASLETLSPTSSTPVDDVPIERVETQQAEASQVSLSVDELLSRGGNYSEVEKAVLKNRITEINQIINTAKETNNPLPKDEYQKLISEKKQLKPLVYENVK